MYNYYCIQNIEIEVSFMGIFNGNKMYRYVSYYARVQK